MGRDVALGRKGLARLHHNYLIFLEFSGAGVVQILDLSRASVVEHHGVHHARGGSGGGDHTSCSDRLGSSLVDVGGSRVGEVGFRGLVAADASAVLVGALRLHLDQICGAIVARGILVGHSWLHHPLQPLALRTKLVHDLVFHLEGVLEVVNHPLFDLLKLLDTHLVDLAEARMLDSFLLVGLGHGAIVSFTTVVRICFGVVAVAEAVVGLVRPRRLLLMLLAEALIVDVLRLSLQFLAHARVLCHHVVRVVQNLLLGLIPAIKVHLALTLFLVGEVHLVPIHHGLVLVASVLDLVGELAVLLGDANLFLQPLLLVMQLAQAVLHHQRLDTITLRVETPVRQRG